MESPSLPCGTNGQKLTKPCLVVRMDTVWTAKKKENYRTYKPGNDFSSQNNNPLNHQPWINHVLNFQVKAWMRWLMRSVVCVPMSCHVVDALGFGPWVGLEGGHDGISRGLHPEVLQNDSVEVAKFVWLERDSDDDYLHALYLYYIYMSQISWSLLKVIIVKFPSCRIAQKVNLSQRSKQVHALSHRWIADFAGLSVESRLRLDRIRWGPLFLPKFLPPTKGVTVQGMHRSVISMFARGFWRGKTGKTENNDWVEKTPKHSC